MLYFSAEGCHVFKYWFSISKCCIYCVANRSNAAYKYLLKADNFVLVQGNSLNRIYIITLYMWQNCKHALRDIFGSRNKCTKNICVMKPCIRRFSLSLFWCANTIYLKITFALISSEDNTEIFSCTFQCKSWGFLKILYVWIY